MCHGSEEIVSETRSLAMRCVCFSENLLLRAVESRMAHDTKVSINTFV